MEASCSCLGSCVFVTLNNSLWRISKENFKTLLGKWIAGKQVVMEDYGELVGTIYHDFSHTTYSQARQLLKDLEDLELLEDLKG